MTRGATRGLARLRFHRQRIFNYFLARRPPTTQSRTQLDYKMICRGTFSRRVIGPQGSSTSALINIPPGHGGANFSRCKISPGRRRRRLTSVVVMAETQLAPVIPPYTHRHIRAYIGDFNHSGTSSAVKTTARTELIYIWSNRKIRYRTRCQSLSRLMPLGGAS